jgi:hypothetical protein
MDRVGPARWGVRRRTGAAHPVPGRPARGVGLPQGLRPRWRVVPRLAWVTARAFGGRRPGRFADVWPVSSAVAVQLPLLAAAVAGDRVAASRDRSAVVVVTTGPAQTAAAGVAWPDGWPPESGPPTSRPGCCWSTAATRAQAYALGLGDLLAWLVFLARLGLTPSGRCGSGGRSTPGRPPARRPDCARVGMLLGRSARGRPGRHATATAGTWSTRSCRRCRTGAPRRSWRLFRLAAASSGGRCMCLVEGFLVFEWRNAVTVGV